MPKLGFSTGMICFWVSILFMASNPQSHLPEWADPQGGPEFAGRVVPGVEKAETVRAAWESRSRWPELGEWERRIIEGDRAHLARAITLIESHRTDDGRLARELLARLLPRSGKAFRVGITGVPGVGKSTLIEHLGLFLCERGHRLAVLAVDPSSQVSGGSVLGDKTRMERLARHPNSFIRPSPTSGALGGVARKSREAVLLCEAAGYDTIFVETVGVGQSEVTVHSMVDCFLVLMLAGAGDELQGIKKGILELADLLAVTKADGDNEVRAETARRELANALHYVTGSGEVAPVLTVSVRREETIAALWASVERFLRRAQETGQWEARRRDQAVRWWEQLLAEEAGRMFFAHPVVAQAEPELRAAVMSMKITHAEGLEELRRRLGRPGANKIETNA